MQAMEQVSRFRRLYDSAIALKLIIRYNRSLIRSRDPVYCLHFLETQYKSILSISPSRKSFIVLDMVLKLTVLHIYFMSSVEFYLIFEIIL